MMAKVIGFAKAFAGRWHIVEMDKWDSDFLNLVEQAHLTFNGKSDSEIGFGALNREQDSAGEAVSTWRASVFRSNCAAGP